MASVKAICTTGDNDPELFPLRYINYYLYCDQCGSFDMKYWSDTESMSGISGLFGIWWKWLSQYGENAARNHGVRCDSCQHIYRYGEPFFTELEANPRQLTMDDVPRPLYTTIQIRGEDLD